jgi:hypothetical protein
MQTSDEHEREKNTLIEMNRPMQRILYCRNPGERCKAERCERTVDASL